MDPRGTVSKIYKEDYYTLLHTKYESSRPCGFEDFFLMFSHCKYMGVNYPRDRAIFDPRGMIGKTLIKRTTTQYYIHNMKALGLVVSEKILFLFFP